MCRSLSPITLSSGVFESCFRVQRCTYPSSSFDGQVRRGNLDNDFFLTFKPTKNMGTVSQFCSGAHHSYLALTINNRFVMSIFEWVDLNRCLLASAESNNTNVLLLHVLNQSPRIEILKLRNHCGCGVSRFFHSAWCVLIPIVAVYLGQTVHKSLGIVKVSIGNYVARTKIYYHALYKILR